MLEIIRPGVEAVVACVIFGMFCCRRDVSSRDPNELSLAEIEGCEDVSDRGDVSRRRRTGLVFDSWGALNSIEVPVSYLKRDGHRHAMCVSGARTEEDDE